MTKPELVDLTQLKFTKNNPNVMSEEKLISLGKFMQRIGFKIPLQVRTENKEIIDGSHRGRWLLDNGITKGLVNWIDCTKAEAIKYRIIFNELHGSMDQDIFAQNLIEIQKAGDLEDFSELMAEELKDFEKTIKDFEESSFIPEGSIQEDIGANDKFRIAFEFEQISEYELVLQTLKELNTNKEIALLQLIGKPHED